VSTTEAKNRRKHTRQTSDGSVTLSTAAEGVNQRFIRGRAIDVSKEGAKIETPDSLQTGSHVYLRTEHLGIMGTATVRHCEKRSAGYVMGLELDKSGPNMKTPDGFIDYYEILQISPKADGETIRRVFRMQAARYHPDNKQTGDKERFLMLSRIFETLIDPKRRAEYDLQCRMRQPDSIPVFGLAEFVAGIDGEINRRLGVLCLLYKRRRSSPDRPALSLLQLEHLMDFPLEHLMFTVSYLLEKEYMRTVESSDYQITYKGIDALEEGVRDKQIFQRLLEAPMSLP